MPRGRKPDRARPRATREPAARRRKGSAVSSAPSSRDQEAAIACLADLIKPVTSWAHEGREEASHVSGEPLPFRSGGGFAACLRCLLAFEACSAHAAFRSLSRMHDSDLQIVTTTSLKPRKQYHVKRRTDDPRPGSAGLRNQIKSSTSRDRAEPLLPRVESSLSRPSTKSLKRSGVGAAAAAVFDDEVACSAFACLVLWSCPSEAPPPPVVSPRRRSCSSP